MESRDARDRLAQQRLGELLTLLASQGLTQQQVAARANLPPQYISDLKHGRRPMTELVARRVGAEFDVDYQWLLGVGAMMSPVRAQGSHGTPLPVFSHPVEGDPQGLSDWDGSYVDIPSAAAAQLGTARWPYVLRFGHSDVHGRLHRGDLVLVSQAPCEPAEIQVVRHRGKLFLARRQSHTTWERLAGGQSLPAGAPAVGHCVGVVWSSLLPAS